MFDYRMQLTMQVCQRDVVELLGALDEGRLQRGSE